MQCLKIGREVLNARSRFLRLLGRTKLSKERVMSGLNGLKNRLLLYRYLEAALLLPSFFIGFVSPALQFTANLNSSHIADRTDSCNGSSSSGKVKMVVIFPALLFENEHHMNINCAIFTNNDKLFVC